MTTTCLPITHVVSSTVYRYKSSSFSRNNSHFLSNIQQKPLKRSFRLSYPLLHHNKFKFTLDAKQVGPEKEEDEKEEKVKEKCKTFETVLKLCSEIKNRNMSGIAEVIGIECQCFCNSLSTFQFLQGKKIVVKPMLTDGRTVGVEWRLEWVKPQILLGNGYGLHVCHVYQGKFMIRNLEMIMEPIRLHLEPLRLKIIASALSLAEKISAYMKPAEENVRKRAANVLLLLALLLFIVAIFLFSKPVFD